MKGSHCRNSLAIGRYDYKDVSELMARRKPSKAVGEIGATKITASKEGTSSEIVASNLPTNKEALELKFAEIFVHAFNHQRPSGPTVVITDLHQNDTSDLDFKIKCDRADYLELAELNPRSESFGRSMFRTGKYNMYQYARWTYLRVIRRKQLAYGSLAQRSFLMLYATHWQFLPTRSTVDCLRACCITYGCQFAGVFYLLTNGDDLQFIELISPSALDPPRKPKDFDATAANLPPGQSAWTVNLSDAGPADN